MAELRAVPADGLWLSPQFKREMLSKHFTWLPGEGAVAAAVRHIEDELTPF